MKNYRTKKCQNNDTLVWSDASVTAVSHGKKLAKPRQKWQICGKIMLMYNELLLALTYSISWSSELARDCSETGPNWSETVPGLFQTSMSHMYNLYFIPYAPWLETFDIQFDHESYLVIFMTHSYESTVSRKVIFVKSQNHKRYLNCRFKLTLLCKNKFYATNSMQQIFFNICVTKLENVPKLNWHKIAQGRFWQFGANGDCSCWEHDCINQMIPVKWLWQEFSRKKVCL